MSDEVVLAIATGLVLSGLSIYAYNAYRDKK
jgi:hypothetical protein